MESVKGSKRKYHIFYKITNNINNHFYYGVHNTDNINDNYMGSGKRLQYAYKKYGMENFTKENLKFFDTAKEAFEYEADYITEELIKDPNCYNIEGGGKGWNTINQVLVKDKDGNTFLISKNDQRYLNKELVSAYKGYICCRKKGETEFCWIPKELYNKNEYETTSSNNVPVKDKSGKFYLVSKDDPRYLNGELVSIWKGKHHKEESKQKMHNTFLKIHHQQGEKNSQFGTCWIHNDEESIKIKKEQLEEYISNGWVKGRKMFKK